jgi:hypothetical protein
VNTTAAAHVLLAAAERFRAAFRRRAHVHHFLQEGLTEDALAAAAESVLDWAEEYAQFDAPYDSGEAAWETDAEEEAADPESGWPERGTARSGRRAAPAQEGAPSTVSEAGSAPRVADVEADAAAADAAARAA